MPGSSAAEDPIEVGPIRAMVDVELNEEVVLIRCSSRNASQAFTLPALVLRWWGGPGWFHRSIPAREK